MSHRRLSNVSQVQLHKKGPFEKKRLEGVREKGMAFERAIHRYTSRLFPQGKHFYDYWLQFSSDQGQGWAQPDKWIVFPDSVLLLECKLSQRKGAVAQLNKLYLPLLTKLYPSLPILRVHAFKNRARGIQCEVLSSLLDVLSLPPKETKQVLFYHHVH